MANMIDLFISCNQRFCFQFVQDSNMPDKLHLVHFSQGLGINLTHANLSSLIPLFADRSTLPPEEKCDTGLRPAAEGSKILPPITTEHAESQSGSIFADTSLFDDGTKQTENQMEDERGMETAGCAEKEEGSNTKTASSSQDSTDTGFSESQQKEETGEDRQGRDHEENMEASLQKGSKLVRTKPTKGMWVG